MTIKSIFQQFLLFVLLFCLSCTVNKEEKNSQHKVSKMTLSVTDTLNLHIDTLTNYQFSFRLAEFNNKEYLVAFNGWKYKFLYYDLNKDLGKPVHVLQLKKEGPDGIQRMQDCITHGWDSIFVLSIDRKIFRVDSAGVIKEKWTAGEENTQGITSSVYFSNPLVKRGKYFYYFKLSGELETNVAYVRDTLGLRLDTKTGEIINKIITWPKLYQENFVHYGRHNYNYSRQILNSGKIVVSFPLDKNLYVYSDTVAIGEYNCKSKYVPEQPKKPAGKFEKYEDERLYQVSIASYTNLYYDKYRELLYRIVLHASDLHDATGNKIKILNKPFSIQIIDAKTFELKGEQDFPANTYDIKNIIPTKRGILISTCNENNSDLQEDRLQFAVFKIEEKKE